MGDQDKKKKKRVLSQAKVDAFLSAFGESDANRLTREAAEQKKMVIAKLGLGTATAQDSLAAERHGILKKKSASELVKERKAANLLALGSTGVTKADSLEYNRLNPGKDIFKKPEDDDKTTPKEQFDNEFYRLSILVVKGKATPEQKAQLSKMRELRYAPKTVAGKKKPSDKMGEYTKKIKSAEDILSAETKTGEGWDLDKETGQMNKMDIKEPKYSDQMRAAATQTQSAYTDSVYWLKETNRIRKAGGPDFNPQELNMRYEQGRAIRDSIIAQYENGELDEMFSHVQPEHRIKYLEKYINQKLDPLDMDNDDIEYFGRHFAKKGN